MAFKQANFEELLRNPLEFARWLADTAQVSLNIPTEDQADALAGSGGTPSAANPYVVAGFPALAGTAGTPSATNKFVTDQDPRLDFPYVGTFTLDAAAFTVVAETAVTASSSIDVPTPTNAAAATLMGSSQHLYIDPADYVVGVSFTVRTADGTPAGGTETFSYRLFSG